MWKISVMFSERQEINPNIFASNMSKNRGSHTKNILKMQLILYSSNKSELTLLLRAFDFVSVFLAVHTGEHPPSNLIVWQFSAQSLQAREFLFHRHSKTLWTASSVRCGRASTSEHQLIALRCSSPFWSCNNRARLERKHLTWPTHRRRDAARPDISQK